MNNKQPGGVSMNESSRLPLILRVLVACVALAGIGTATAAAEERVQFRIAPQDLLTALNEFAQQSDQELLFSTDVAASKRTDGVTGEFPPTEALRALLEGTGLQYRVTTENTILIERTEKEPSDRRAETTSSVFRTPLVLAQATPASQPPHQDTESSATNAQAAKDEPDDEARLGDMTVTGSHIRGAEPVGAHLITIGRREIDESGYATVQDALKTLPQNFGDAVSEDFVTDFTAGNVNSGTSANLRGLGYDSTLVLVNGRRQPGGGIFGSFVDISSIASAAVERIEILPDGASAIYGSDAVGGVVNIILRRNYEGAELRARLGTFDGDATETQVSQLFGNAWASGSALVGYQYYERDALARADRKYTASDDLRRFGGDDFRITNSNPGNILDPNTFQPAFAIPPGQDGTALTPSDLLPGQVNYHNFSELGELLPEQKMHSAFVAISQRLNESLELFAEGRYSTRDISIKSSGYFDFLFVPSSNPFFVDPFGGSPFVIVAYNFLDDFGPVTQSGNTETYSASLGATANLSDAWQVSLSGAYGEEKTWSDVINTLNFRVIDATLADPDPATAFNPFGEGSNTNPATLAAIRGTQDDAGASQMWVTSLIADGPLFALPGGTSKLAIGVDYREEEILPDLAGTRSKFGRQVSSVFAEMTLPLAGSTSANPGLQRLNVSVAGRYEHYSDFGDTFNPKVGLTWLPVDSMSFRGTWGTSFKAPKLIELPVTPFFNFSQLVQIPDPQSPTGQSFVLMNSGNNPNLKEETATTWTLGFDISPIAVRGLTLSLTYYDIEYEDRVAAGGPPADPFSILLQEEQWSPLITRNPSQSEIDAICSSPLFFGSPSDCTNTPPAAIVDLRLRNLAAIKVRGVDLDLGKTLQMPYGNFDFGIYGSYTLNFKRAVSSASPEFDVVDTVQHPLALRLRGRVSWNHHGFGANTFVNYSGSYTDDLSEPDRKIGSWTTIDLRLAYRTALGDGWLDDVELALNAVNLFNEPPPFVNNGFFGYDTANADLYGRIVSLQLAKAW